MGQAKSLWGVDLFFGVGKNLASGLRIIPEWIGPRFYSLFILVVPVDRSLFGTLGRLRSVQHTARGYWRQVACSSAILVTCFVERLGNTFQVQIQLLLYLWRDHLWHTFSSFRFTSFWAWDVTRLRHRDEKLFFWLFLLPLPCLRFSVKINLF